MLIDQLSAHEPIELLREVFELLTRATTTIPRRAGLQMPTGLVYSAASMSCSDKVEALPAAAVSCRVVWILQEDGEQIGRLKVRALMRELGLSASKPARMLIKKQQWNGLMFRIF